MSWRSPTREQQAQVLRRLAGREKAQKLISFRNSLPDDPDIMSSLRDSQVHAIRTKIERVDRLLKEDPTLNYFPFDKQIDFHRHDRKSKVEMLIAGNRSGKTTCICIESVWWAVGNHPYMWTPPPPVNIWLTSVDYGTLENTIKDEKLLSWLPPETHYERQKRIFTLLNGSKIFLKSQEAGQTKFESASVHMIGWDEEGESETESERIFKACITRMIDTEGMLMMALTMVNCYGWLDEMAGAAENGSKRVSLYGWPMTDNPHLPPAEIEEARAQFTEEEALVRIYGKRVKIGLKTIFPRDILLKLLEETKGQTYDFAEVVEKTVKGKPKIRLRFVKEATMLRIYERWQEKVEYILAADPSGGDGGNPSGVVILRRDTLSVCVVLKSNILSPSELAVQIYRLGMIYRVSKMSRSALVGVENNNHGHAVVQKLEELGYDNMWRDRTVSGAELAEAGFRTNPKTKPMLEGHIMDALRSGTLKVRDFRIVEELASYRRKPTGSTGAAPGKYDDLVIALGIALYIHEDEPLEQFEHPKRESYYAEPGKLDPDKPADIWRDAEVPAWQKTIDWRESRYGQGSAWKR